MHGGTVTASSPGKGKGSTFIIRLPLAAGLQEDAPKQIQAKDESNRASRPLKVVVADDNTDAAESLATVLQLGGHETVIAHDGYDALKQILASRPEVIFLDIGMPGLTKLRQKKPDSAIIWLNPPISRQFIVFLQHLQLSERDICST